MAEKCLEVLRKVFDNFLVPPRYKLFFKIEWNISKTTIESYFTKICELFSDNHGDFFFVLIRRKSFRVAIKNHGTNLVEGKVRSEIGQVESLE